MRYAEDSVVREWRKGQGRFMVKGNLTALYEGAIAR